MGKVQRIYPGALNGLINYLEENFHEIDQYVVTLVRKDGTADVFYDTYSVIEGLGMASMTHNALSNEAFLDEFVPKERERPKDPR